MHDYFAELFKPGPRLIAASLLTFFMTQRAELALFSWMQVHCKSSFVFRASITVILVQGLDTVTFSFLGLWGLVHSLFDIIVVSFAIKLLVVLVTTPFLVFSQKIVSKDRCLETV